MSNRSPTNGLDHPLERTGGTGIDTIAVVFEQPERLALTRLTLAEPCAEDVVVDICWSGISTGTERLLWTGRMPDFPGMGYPLVPGYESVGRVRAAGPAASAKVGDLVFVPGARCFGDVRGLFGGAAQTVVVPATRAIVVAEHLGVDATLLALAATAHHALVSRRSRLPDLIVGHGVLGRLLARMTLALGGAAPTVWETNADRIDGALGYPVIDPATDPRRDYLTICDVSGDASLLDTLIARLAPGGEVVLAGFYSERLAFAFPPAFMREARIRVAAQWQQQDVMAAKQLAESGRLSLANLITHRQPAASADSAYRTAFGDPACLKMILDWSTPQ